MSNIPPPHDGTQPDPYGQQPPTYQPQYSQQPYYGQPTQPLGQQPPPPPFQPPVKKKRKWPFVAGAVAVLLVIVAIAAPTDPAPTATPAAPAPAASSAPSAPAETPEVDTDDQPTETPTPPPAPPKADPPADPEPEVVNDIEIMSCKDLVEDVVSISEGSDNEVKIIGVYKVNETRDRQKKWRDGKLKIADSKIDVDVLNCTGLASLNTDNTQKIKFQLSYDEDSKAFVGYGPA